jgi:hypothetical protein
MGFRRLLLNLAGAAAAGFGGAIATAAPAQPISGRVLIMAVLAPVVFNLIGIVQQPPPRNP